MSMGKHRAEALKKKAERKRRQMDNPSGRSKYAMKVAARRKGGSE